MLLQLVPTLQEIPFSLSLPIPEQVTLPLPISFQEEAFTIKAQEQNVPEVPPWRLAQFPRLPQEALSLSRQEAQSQPQPLQGQAEREGWEGAEQRWRLGEGGPAEGEADANAPEKLRCGPAISQHQQSAQETKPNSFQVPEKESQVPYTKERKERQEAREDSRWQPRA